MRHLLLAAAVMIAAPATAHPLGNPIPAPFHGLYGRTAASCNDANEIAFLTVTADQIAYYEGNEYLLLGIAFEGAGPMFNGRFVSRESTQIMGEGNLQLAMETPDIMVRYELADGADEPAAGAERDAWIRCPGDSLQARLAR